MVSVIIPTYNRADTIKRSIESVLSQSYQDFEIIIIDDGSTDDTYRVVKEIRDTRICYIKGDKRMGANAARNIGVQRAKGEFIAFQDSDDIWRKDKLEKQMEVFAEKDDVSVVYSRYQRHYVNGETALVPNKSYSKEALQEKLMFTLAKLNVIGTPTMIVRKKCFSEHGKFDLELQRFQDWDVNIKFIQHYKYGFIDEVLVDAYVLSDGITNSVISEFDNVLFIVKKHQIFFEAQSTLDMHLERLYSIALREKRLVDLQKILGEKLFFRSIYLNSDKTVKRQESIRINYLFIKEWMNKEKNSYIVNHFLFKYPDNSIVLYGWGDIGKLFINVLTDENKKKIKFIIDQKSYVHTSEGYRIVSLEMMDGKELEGIECIIITAVAHEEEIRWNLEKNVSVPIVSAYEVIED